MDYFDKKVKDELTQFEPNIPDGMEWGEMEEGVLARMPRKKVFYPFIWWGVGSLIGLVFIFVLWSMYNSSIESEKNINEANVNINEFRTTTESALKTNITSPIVVKPALDIDQNINSKVNIINSTKLLLSTEKTNTKKQITLVKSNITTTSSLDKNRNKSVPQISEVPSLINDYNVINKILTESDYSRGKVSFFEDKPLINTISSLEIKVLDLPYITLPINSNTLIFGEVAFKQSHTVGLSISSIFWNWGAIGDQDHHKLEETLFSYGTTVAYGYRMSKHFSIETGMQYSQLESVFDHSFIIDEKIEFRENIEQKEYNVVTKETTDIVEDGNVLVTTLNHIKHYNNYKNISIPVLLNSHFDFSRVNVKIGVGAAVSIFSSEQGRSINENGSKLDFSTSTNQKINKGLSGLMKAELIYPMGEKYALSLNLSYQKYLTNWMKVETGVRKPEMYRIGVGITSRL